MIRRAAVLIADSTKTGWVLAWLVKVDSSGTETMVLVYEKADDGTVSEMALSAIKFADGGPATIPEIP